VFKTWYILFVSKEDEGQLKEVKNREIQNDRLSGDGRQPTEQSTGRRFRCKFQVFWGFFRLTYFV